MVPSRYRNMCLGGIVWIIPNLGLEEFDPLLIIRAENLCFSPLHEDIERLLQDIAVHAVEIYPNVSSIRTYYKAQSTRYLAPPSSLPR